MRTKLYAVVMQKGKEIERVSLGNAILFEGNKISGDKYNRLKRSEGFKEARKITGGEACRYIEIKDELDRRANFCGIYAARHQVIKFVEVEKFYTSNRETRTFIDCFENIGSAKFAIRAYEANDRANGVYEEDFYDVVDKDHTSVL